MKFQQLPEQIILLLLDFLESNETITVLSSTKEFYQSLLKANIRKITLAFTGNCDNSWWQKVQGLIVNPCNQLKVSARSRPNESLLNFLNQINNSVYELRCPESQNFLPLMDFVETLCVKHLAIRYRSNRDPNDDEAICLSLSKIFNVQSLTLSFTKSAEANVIPYIPSLNTLFLRTVNFLSSSELLKRYSNHIHHLSLSCCMVSDVSMLGSIPCLELRRCDELIDISALQNNDHIVIEECKKLRNFSQSFINSRKIEIIISSLDSSYSFDLTRWKKVEDLSLCDSSDNGFPINHGQLIVPTSVKKLVLEGSFILSIDFTITSGHVMKEIKLVNNNSVLSLDGCGLERVAIITVESFGCLQSLDGLGKGVNRKITITNCENITDFTPLNHIPVAEISCCKGFKNLLQLRSVHDLTIVPNSEVILSSNPLDYEHICSLTILCAAYISKFDGLERIPRLQLDFDKLVMIFLLKGKRLENQRIEIRNPSSAFDALIEIHEQYMKEHYDYFSQLPTKWVWIRKDSFSQEK